MQKKILVLGTGGTIASRKSAQGLIPAADVSELTSCIPELEQLCRLNQIQVFSLDSTNVQPEHWLMLVKCIKEYYEAYDGFLILHGTDTMAYTAAALSYLIQNTKKPIVLTGSQLPMEDENTDAKTNILQSVQYLIDDRACGVSIVFAGKVIPGGRARKVRSHTMEAFECVGYEFDPMQRIQQSTESPVFYEQLNTNVLIWKLIPGMRPDTLLKASEDYQGVVIEGFGLGGLPDLLENDYFPVLKSLVEQGKTIAVTTQVPLEGSDMSVYEVGMRYKKELPILEGKTMTPESMAVKLMWVLGCTKDPKKIAELFNMPINYDLI